MSENEFETISLLLNWMEMGRCWRSCSVSPALFELIGNTQREMRRAIRH
jgi:hypothetical protein